MTLPIVEVDGLRKVYSIREGALRPRSQLVAVDDVSFRVSDSGSLAIVGESGSGKTTTARIIVGLEQATSGRIVVAGREREGGRVSSGERRRRAREAQIVFQDPYSSLDPRQKIAACLDEVLRLHFPGAGRDERRERIASLLDRVGLDERHGGSLPRNLSGGQRQRAAIARALATEPRVLVLDEAVASLDVSIQAQILNLLADIREQLAISYIFVSHDLAVIRQVTDDAIVMRKGRVVEEGRTAQILGDPQHPYTQLLLRSVPHPGWKPKRGMAAALLGSDSEPAAAAR